MAGSMAQAFAQAGLVDKEFAKELERMKVKQQREQELKQREELARLIEEQKTEKRASQGADHEA